MLLSVNTVIPSHCKFKLNSFKLRFENRKTVAMIKVLLNLKTFTFTQLIILKLN
jgi:hypothetical protein